MGLGMLGVPKLGTEHASSACSMLSIQHVHQPLTHTPNTVRTVVRSRPQNNKLFPKLEQIQGSNLIMLGKNKITTLNVDWGDVRRTSPPFTISAPQPPTIRRKRAMSVRRC